VEHFTQQLWGPLFATEYAQLHAEQQAALTGDGLPLNKLPETMYRVIQGMFEAGIRGGTFILDPNAAVRVNITQVEGAKHYTVTARASFLVNLLVRDEPPQPPA
jgi:hypothetical protein